MLMRVADGHQPPLSWQAVHDRVRSSYALIGHVGLFSCSWDNIFSHRLISPCSNGLLPGHPVLFRKRTLRIYSANTGKFRVPNAQQQSHSQSVISNMRLTSIPRLSASRRPGTTVRTAIR